MQTKHCGSCDRIVALDHFYKCAGRKDGLQTRCKDCARTKSMDWAKANPDVALQHAQRYRSTKVDYIKARSAGYQKANPGMFAYHTAIRHKRLRAATPKWLSESQLNEIRAKYLEAAELTRRTGVAYEVDHIEPIAGTNASGLHVPWNLRVIPALDNRRKGNRPEPLHADPKAP